MLDDSGGVVNGKFNGIPIEDSLEYGRLQKEKYKTYNLDAEQKWKKLTVRLAEEMSQGYTMARLANEIGYKAIGVHTWAQAC